MVRYRFHKKGTIHCLAGCCKIGQKIKADNYIEVFTVEEAKAWLWERRIVANKCSFCDWSKDKEETKK